MVLIHIKSENEIFTGQWGGTGKFKDAYSQAEVQMGPPKTPG